VVLAGGVASGGGATVLLSLAFSALRGGLGIGFFLVAGFFAVAVGVGLLIIGAALLASTLDARHEAALELPENQQPLQPTSTSEAEPPWVVLARF
jgi:hypothetical protein